MHRRIYETLGQLIRAGKLATVVTMKTFLADIELPAGVTIQAYLARLAAEATTIINAEDYGRIVHDLATRRDLISIGEEIVNTAFDSPVDASPRAQIEEAERKLYSIAETGRYEGGFQRFSDALTIAIDMASSAYMRDGHLSGIATGLVDLDEKMGGLQKSDLIIVAGRPGMGKTALATNIAFNIARAYQYEVEPDGSHKTINGGIVGFFSLEMSAEQLATRVIAEQSGVPSYKIRRGDLNQDDFERIVQASREMQSIPFYIDQSGGISIAQLVARARRLKRQKGLDLLVVDYLQLLIGSRSRGDNRVQELTEITTGLKALAKELNVPVDRAVAALASGRIARRQAPAALGPARIRLDRTGRGRRALRLSRGILSEEQGAARRHGRTYQLDGRDGARAWPRRGHHRQAAPRPDRHRPARLRGRSHALLQPCRRG